MYVHGYLLLFSIVFLGVDGCFPTQGEDIVPLEAVKCTASEYIYFFTLLYWMLWCGVESKNC